MSAEAAAAEIHQLAQHRDHRHHGAADVSPDDLLFSNCWSPYAGIMFILTQTAWLCTGVE